MICRVGDRRDTGTAVSIEASLDPERVAGAVRTGVDEAAEPVVEIRASAAGPLHDRVGCIHPSVTLRPRTALAVAARSLGWSTDVDDEIRRLRAELSGTPPAAVPDRSDLRRQVAEAEANVERLRERVAATRGRRDGDVEAAVRSLSEAETSLAAARERRECRRETAEAGRDRLEAELALRDRLGNREREARRELVDRVRDRYVAALAGVPKLRAVEKPFAAPPDAMALAVARVGPLKAPVVVATGRFSSADRAANWLDAPAVHLEP